ncbi:hypothetical protein E2320_013563 [Naja naja]|nr:hypothetical protein E2320_013563 [Naja naja]
MFVRKKFRRRGLGMQMLQDFCQSFPSEDALGLSCPLSADMEKGLPDKPMADLGDHRGPPDLPSQSDGLQLQLKADEPEKLKKRTRGEEPAVESVAKHLRTIS